MVVQVMKIVHAMRVVQVIKSKKVKEIKNPNQEVLNHETRT